MPTGHGMTPSARSAEQAPEVLVTGPLSRTGQRWERDSTLLSLALAGAVARASLAAMTDDPNIAPTASAQPEDPGAAGPATSAIRELADIPAVEVITRSIVMLMSAAAEKLGLSSQDPDDSPNRDLDEARRLITALAGLVTASAEYLGPHAGPVRDGLKGLQLAFRESSASPEEAGHGPGEKYTGPVW
jgi:Domain of unknown function (DUF1844)